MGVALMAVAIMIGAVIRVVRLAAKEARPIHAERQDKKPPMAVIDNAER
jgi:hypothetical protein